MTDRKHFGGVYAVVPTPLYDDESVDYEGLEHLLNYYIDSGCHGAVVLGSGGEFPYFSFEERIQIVKTSVKAVQGKIALLAGAGFSFSLAETKLFLKEAGTLGLDGFLVILPTISPDSVQRRSRFLQGHKYDFKQTHLLLSLSPNDGTLLYSHELAWDVRHRRISRNQRKGR